MDDEGTLAATTLDTGEFNPIAGLGLFCPGDVLLTAPHIPGLNAGALRRSSRNESASDHDALWRSRR